MKRHMYAPSMMLCVVSAITILAVPCLGQSAKPAEGKSHVEKDGSGSAKAGNSQLRVFHLLHLTAPVAIQILEKLYPRDDVRIATNPQTNDLIVLGSREMLELIEQLLLRLDEENAPRRTVHTEILALPKSDGLLKDNGQFINRIAESVGVEFAVQKDLGIVMFKGSQESVKNILEIIQRTQKIQTKESDIGPPAKPAQSTEKVLRVLWLATKVDGRDWSAPDAFLKPVVDKLGTMGFKDVGVVGQVLTRCQLSEKPTDFQVQGRVETHRSVAEFIVEGAVSPVPTDPLRHDAKIKILVSLPNLGRTAAQQPAQSHSASVGVVVHLVENKPIVVASTPMDDLQSFFVVQLLSGE